MTHYLYRKSARRAIAGILAIFLTVTIGSAQQRGPSTITRKSKRGPRAIAVVEFLPGGGMRLVPIALWIDGKYYDASLYGANPEPMAVEPETVYEAQSLGEPTGTFTITEPLQIKGSWIAEGTWRPHLAMDEQVAARAAKEAANKTKPEPEQDGLHRRCRRQPSGAQARSRAPAVIPAVPRSHRSPPPRAIPTGRP